MTVYTWRQGSATKTKLPAVGGEKPRSVEFEPKVLKAWARNNGVALAADPVALATGRVELREASFTLVSGTQSKQDTKPSKSKQIRSQRASH